MHPVDNKESRMKISLRVPFYSAKFIRAFKPNRLFIFVASSVALAVLITFSLATALHHTHYDSQPTVHTGTAAQKSTHAAQSQEVSAKPETSEVAPATSSPPSESHTATGSAANSSPIYNPYRDYDHSLTCPATATIYQDQAGRWGDRGWTIADSTGEPLFPKTISAQYVYFAAGSTSPGQDYSSSSLPAGFSAYQGAGEYDGLSFDFPIELDGTHGRVYSCTVHVTFVGNGSPSTQ